MIMISHSQSQSLKLNVELKSQVSTYNVPPSVQTKTYLSMNAYYEPSMVFSYYYYLLLISYPYPDPTTSTPYYPTLYLYLYVFVCVLLYMVLV